MVDVRLPSPARPRPLPSRRMSTRRPAAVLFDFDGVLVNSEPLHCAAFQQVFAAAGLPLSDERYYRDLIGFDDRGAIAAWFAAHDRPLPPALARQLEAE